jgi:hypothetical protein
VGELIREHGLATVTAYMGFIQANAEGAVRDMLRDFSLRQVGGREGGGGRWGRGVGAGGGRVAVRDMLLDFSLRQVGGRAFGGRRGPGEVGCRRGRAGRGRQMVRALCRRGWRARAGCTAPPIAARPAPRPCPRRQGLPEVGTVTAADQMDDGSPIVLSVTIDRTDGSATFDFEGTGPEVRAAPGARGRERSLAHGKAACPSAALPALAPTHLLPQTPQNQPPPPPPRCTATATRPPLSPTLPSSMPCAAW